VTLVRTFVSLGLLSQLGQIHGIFVTHCSRKFLQKSEVSTAKRNCITGMFRTGVHARGCNHAGAETNGGRENTKTVIGIRKNADSPIQLSNGKVLEQKNGQVRDDVGLPTVTPPRSLDIVVVIEDRDAVNSWKV